jgi:predicted membrane metal-binding protein
MTVFLIDARHTTRMTELRTEIFGKDFPASAAITVAGFAAVAGAGIWLRRNLPRTLRGWRRWLARHLVISAAATLVTAPLVAWTFGRVSLVAPITNVLAGPVIVLLQPTLFLAMLLAMLLTPAHAAAQFVAGSGRTLQIDPPADPPARQAAGRQGLAGDGVGGILQGPEDRLQPLAGQASIGHGRVRLAGVR